MKKSWFERLRLPSKEKPVYWKDIYNIAVALLFLYILIGGCNLAFWRQDYKRSVRAEQRAIEEHEWKRQERERKEKQEKEKKERERRGRKLIPMSH